MRVDARRKRAPRIRLARRAARVGPAARDLRESRSGTARGRAPRGRRDETNQEAR